MEFDIVINKNSSKKNVVAELDFEVVLEVLNRPEYFNLKHDEYEDDITLNVCYRILTDETNIKSDSDILGEVEEYILRLPYVNRKAFEASNELFIYLAEIEFVGGVFLGSSNSFELVEGTELDTIASAIRIMLNDYYEISINGFVEYVKYMLDGNFDKFDSTVFSSGYIGWFHSDRAFFDSLKLDGWDIEDKVAIWEYFYTVDNGNGVIAFYLS